MYATTGLAPAAATSGGGCDDGFAARERDVREVREWEERGSAGRLLCDRSRNLREESRPMVAGRISIELLERSSRRRLTRSPISAKRRKGERGDRARKFERLFEM